MENLDPPPLPPPPKIKDGKMAWYCPSRLRAASSLIWRGWGFAFPLYFVQDCRSSSYRKIPKISPGVYIFQTPFLRCLSVEGNLRFKIDWTSLIVGRKFTVFALFYFVFEGNFPSTSPRGAYIWRGDLTEGFLRYEFGGLIFGGAYFRNFTVFDSTLIKCKT